MEKLKEKAVKENTRTKSPVPISSQDRPWQKNMSKDGGKKSLPELNDSQWVATEDHKKTLKYLADRRVLRIEAEKNEVFGNLDGSAEESRNEKKHISDTVFSKILNDKNMSEYERMEAVRLRAEQIEEKAFMSE